MTETLDVAVIGAGMSGMYAIVKLREMGLTHRVFEAGADVGGTWYWNHYPGARCDIGSLDYSYSFSPELEQEWVWSEKYATQSEILSYLNHVAKRFDLRRDVTFNTRVTAAEWDEHKLEWRVETDTGDSVRAQFLIMAPGALSKPNMPRFPGMETFAGPIYHTSAWPHGGVDFSGLTVGVIGTGSSGIQAIPPIADQAKSLTVFQRTAVYAMPAYNRPLDEREVAERKGRYGQAREANRNSGFGVAVPAPEPSALSVAEQQRTAHYEERWHAGDLTGLITAYADLLVDREANETLAAFVRSKIRSIVKDPVTAELLSPNSFPIGTKRPCLATDYYETFNKPHVKLVDLRATPITEITEHGVRTLEQAYSFDALVFATGFDAVTGAFLSVDVRGIGGLSLRDKWADGPRSYLGLAVAGFPNLFTVTGPGSPSVFSNMVVSIEQHIDWITAYMDTLRRRGVRATEATVEAENEWVEHAAEVGATTLYPQADSWYMGANIPGKPRMLLAYIGGVGAYRALCDEVAEKGYPGFRSIAAPGQPKSAGGQTGDARL